MHCNDGRSVVRQCAGPSTAIAQERSGDYYAWLGTAVQLKAVEADGVQSSTGVHCAVQKSEFCCQGYQKESLWCDRLVNGRM